MSPNFIFIGPAMRRVVPHRWSVLGLLAALSAWANPSPPGRTVPEIPTVGRVSWLHIDESVDPGLASYLKRVLAEHREGELVVLEINTLGGRLDSALVIRDAMAQTRATTLCWVKPRAISAGALIALGCDVLAMTPGATMGAATPVTLSASGEMKPVEAKVVSYMRQEMATTASSQKRNPLIAEAMVDMEVEVPGLVEAGKLLTLTSAQALQWQMADLEATTEPELWEKLGRTDVRIERPQPTAAERATRHLATPGVAMVLLMLGLLGIGVELFHPVGGGALLLGLMCLGLFFFGHLLADLAGWMELALIVAGVALLLIEYFTPGSTLFGALGVPLLLGGLFLAMFELGSLPLSVAWPSFLLRALAVLMGACLLAVAAVALLIRFAPRSAAGHPLVLSTQLSTPPENSVPQGIGLEALVGEAGVALTDLRPHGRVEVINKRVEARLELGFASAGARVRVVAAEGNRVVVREDASGEGPTS